MNSILKLLALQGLNGGGGKEPVLVDQTFFMNGTYEPLKGTDGYRNVTVNYLKMLKDINITANGTYTVPRNYDGYGTLEVAVKPNLAELFVIKNGTVNVPSGYDGIGSVVVNVPQEVAPDLPEEAYLITGDCSYRFSNNGWNWFIENYGDKVRTQDITNISSMFMASNNIDYIPFDLNLAENPKYVSSGFSFDQIFTNCHNLHNLPKVNLHPNFNSYISSFSNMISGQYIFEIDDDYFTPYIPFTTAKTSAGNGGPLGSNLYSLKKIPNSYMPLLKKLDEVQASASYQGGIYNKLASGWYNLRELRDIYVSRWELTSNKFKSNSPFYSLRMIRHITFETNEDGTPIVARWKSQILDLSNAIGWDGRWDSQTYATGILPTDRIYNDATYAERKNNENAWADYNSKQYSFYNHDSAVETINSLPDTSAYLTTAGGTNTIKFLGESGSKTDAGAINTLTPEEIAVASAKGWTITLV